MILAGFIVYLLDLCRNFPLMFSVNTFRMGHTSTSSTTSFSRCVFVSCTVSGSMSSDDFYGPALPPGFKKGTSDKPTAKVHPRVGRDRKRRHSSSSDSSSSSSSSQASDRENGDRGRLSEKDNCTGKSSERLFGPALPVRFSPAGETPSKESSFIGPVLPPAATAANVTPADDDDDDDFGPSPALNTDTKTQSTIEQIESRAKMMKDKLEGKVLFCSIVFYLYIFITGMLLF